MTGADRRAGRTLSWTSRAGACRTSSRRSRARAYTALTELTVRRLLARAIRSILTDPRATDRAFDITNGDLFRWSRLWPRLAAYFGLPCGQVRPLRLATWMADKEAV